MSSCENREQLSKGMGPKTNWFGRGRDYGSLVISHHTGLGVLRMGGGGPREQEAVWQRVGELFHCSF